jgi:glycosyltransferase involved in cell wall biosynthesis
MTAPTITAVIPIYNGELLVRDAVESVFSQTALPDEVVVVDDGSTDGTPRMLRRLASEYPLKAITTPNRGQASAINVGVRAARHEFIALLDHDDVWHSDKLERQVEQLVTDPSLGMSFTGVNRVRGTTKEVMALDEWDPDPAEALSRFLAGVCVATPSAAVVRRAALVRIGFVSRIRPYGSDWLMWLMLAAHGVRIGHIPDPLVEYRQHESNVTRSATYAETGCRVMDAFFRQHPDVSGARYWRAHWHMVAAERGDGRMHLARAALIRPRSVRPGWLRLAVTGSAAPPSGSARDAP